MTEADFTKAFIERLTYLVGTEALDPGYDRYAQQTARTYWEDPELRADGPEECADAEFAYQTEG